MFGKTRFAAYSAPAPALALAVAVLAPFSAQAISCGTVAAPTACTITAGAFQYTASGFSLSGISAAGGAITPTAADVAIDLTNPGGTLASLKISQTGGGTFVANVNQSLSFTVNYTMAVTPTAPGSAVFASPANLAAPVFFRSGTGSAQIGWTIAAQPVCAVNSPSSGTTCTVPAATSTLANATAVAINANAEGNASFTSVLEVFDAVFAPAPVSAFLVRYAANLAIGESVVNFTNTGESSTAAFGPTFAQNGEICANVFAYSPDEQLVSCCSCNVTPNALNSLSVKADLGTNTLTPIIPSALVIKVVATPGGTACTASSAATVNTAVLQPGLEAWGTTIHAVPVSGGTTAGTYGVTETPFSRATISSAELTRMAQLCSFIRANGSGYGICKSCKVGGLGASSK